MPSQHADPARSGMAEDPDPAMLVGALGDERTGLEVDRDSATDQDDTANQVEEPPPTRE
jgi:hypothetical protein